MCEFNEVQIINYLRQSNDKLEEFNENIDFIPYCKFIYQTIKMKDYSNIKIAINDLRRLLKFEKKIFETLFENIYHLFNYIIKSQDDYLKEEILIFLCGIIFQRRLFGNYFYDWISEFIYYLIQIYLNDNQNKALSYFILNKLTEDIGILKYFIRYFNGPNKNICLEAYEFFIKTLLKNIESIKQNIHINWNQIYRLLGNIYNQGDKNIILNCVNEIKKICKINLIDYQIILNEFTEFGLINSHLYEMIRNKSIY